MDPPQSRLLDHWLRNIRDVMRLHEAALDALPDDEARYRRLVELNAAEQAYNLRRSPIVEAAWERGQPLAVHALVYDIKDGVLRDLNVSASAASQAPPRHVTELLEEWRVGDSP
jgi:carbonic anhydrase